MANKKVIEYDQKIPQSHTADEPMAPLRVLFQTLLNVSSWCLVMVEWLFLAVPQGCLQFMIVVFPDHTHLLFLSLNRHCLMKKEIKSILLTHCEIGMPGVNQMMMMGRTLDSMTVLTYRIIY